MSKWKPGDIVGRQTGHAMWQRMLVLSVDPWKVVDLDGDPIVPEAPTDAMYKIDNPSPDSVIHIAEVMGRHGFHEQANRFLLPHAAIMERGSKNTEDGALRSIRAQAEHINLCHKEIATLKAEVERLKKELGK
jgi:hypothetical protein